MLGSSKSCTDILSSTVFIFHNDLKYNVEGDAETLWLIDLLVGHTSGIKTAWTFILRITEVLGNYEFLMIFFFWGGGGGA